MENLSHWDFAEYFTGEQAAALIGGVDPSEKAYSRAKADPIYERMRECYQTAWLEVEIANDAPSPERLVSMSLASLAHNQPGRDLLMEMVCEGSPRVNFERQHFSRQEISRWLKVNGLNSVYKFDQELAVTNPTVKVGKWPWGDHHTEALGHLEAAALRFWGADYYDPADSGTAPLNEDVSGWLQKERGVSKTLATAMASILRLDGLPTGPRK